MTRLWGWAICLLVCIQAHSHAKSHSISFTSTVHYQADNRNSNPGKKMGSAKGEVRFDPAANRAFVLFGGKQYSANLLSFERDTKRQGNRLWLDLSVSLDVPTQRAIALASLNSSWRSKKTKAAAERVLERHFAKRASWGAPDFRIGVVDREEGGGCYSFPLPNCTSVKRVYRTEGSQCTQPFSYEPQDPDGYAWFTIKLDRQLKE